MYGTASMILISRTTSTLDLFPAGSLLGAALSLAKSALSGKSVTISVELPPVTGGGDDIAKAVKAARDARRADGSILEYGLAYHLKGMKGKVRYWKVQVHRPPPRIPHST